MRYFGFFVNISIVTGYSPGFRRGSSNRLLARFPQQKQGYEDFLDRCRAMGIFFAWLRYLTISAGFPNLPPHSTQPPPSSPLDGAMDDSGIVAQPRHSRGGRPDPRRVSLFPTVPGAAADERFLSVGPRPFPSSPWRKPRNEERRSLDKRYVHMDTTSICAKHVCGPFGFGRSGPRVTPLLSAEEMQLLRTP